jgi:hypothetical protein
VEVFQSATLLSCKMGSVTYELHTCPTSLPTLVQGNVAGLPHLQSGAPLLSKTWVIVQVERYEGARVSAAAVLAAFRAEANSIMQFGIVSSGDVHYLLVHKSNSARFYPAVIAGHNIMTYTIATVAGAARSRERVMTVIRAWHDLGGERIPRVICPHALCRHPLTDFHLSL